jgi:hypothetical protein
MFCFQTHPGEGGGVAHESTVATHSHWEGESIRRVTPQG